MTGRFLGRDREITTLKTALEQPYSKICALYGRRRIGKTALIREVFGKENVLFFVGLENQEKREQIEHFIFQLKTQIKIERNSSKSIKKWRDAFLLIPHSKKRRTVIVLDELQWMANYRSDLISELKYVWDNYLEDSNVILVLCGSVASFMTDQVIKGKALYGRIETIIPLKPFRLHDLKLFLPNRGSEELVLAYLLVGGVPTYLRMLQKYDSILQGIAKEAFQDNGYFVEEFDRIFISHFGTKSKYETIIKALSKHLQLSRNEVFTIINREKDKEITKTKINNIKGSKKINGGGGELTRLLYNLEVAEFIRSYTPYDKPSRSKHINYLLSDQFLRLYLSFIQHYRLRNAFQDVDFFREIYPTPKFKSWLGLGFEQLCLNHSSELAKKLGFNGIAYKAGPYFRSLNSKTDKNLKNPGFQFDLVFDRADKIITICEMKFQESPIGIEVAHEIQMRIDKISNFQNKTVQKVLITKSPATKDLIRSGFFSKIIQLEELLAD